MVSGPCGQSPQITPNPPKPNPNDEPAHGKSGKHLGLGAFRLSGALGVGLGGDHPQASRTTLLWVAGRHQSTGLGLTQGERGWLGGNLDNASVPQPSALQEHRGPHLIPPPGWAEIQDRGMGG